MAALLGGADSDGYRALLSYGLADIWSSDASTITDADIESMLRDPNATPAQNIAASSLSSSFASVSSSSASAVPASTAASVTRHDASVVMAHSLESSLYYYDGVDQKSASNTSSSSSSLSMEAADQRLMADETSDKLFSDLMAAAAAAAIESHAVGSKRRSMNSSSSSSITTSTAIMSTDDRARLENERAEKRQRLAASAEQRRVAKEARQRAEWQAAGYVSLALPLDDDVDNSESADEADDDNHLDGNRMSDGDVSGSNKSEPHDGLHFVVGDATRPEPTPGYDGGAVILACVDNGGTWGRGGFFGALSALSPLIASAYERAGEFGDLKIGTAHLVDVSAASSVSCSSSSSSSPSSSSSSTSSSLGALYVALLVVQSRPRGGGGPSAVQHDALLRALRAVGRIALARRLSVHSPRLGWGTPGFNWYGTERSLRRMVAVGVPVCVYYFRRRQQQQQPEQHEEGHLDNHKQLVARSESITAPPAPLVVNHDSLFSLSLNAEHAGSVDSAPLVSALDHPRARSAALRDIFGGVEVAVAAPSTCSETEAALVRALRRNLLAHGATVVEAAVAVAALGAAVSPSMVIGSAESRVCVWPRDSATEVPRGALVCCHHRFLLMRIVFCFTPALRCFSIEPAPPPFCFVSTFGMAGRVGAAASARVDHCAPRLGRSVRVRALATRVRPIPLVMILPERKIDSGGNSCKIDHHGTSTGIGGMYYCNFI